MAVEDVDIAGVPATWIGEPSLSERGTILYLHGGAWCIHLPAVYRRFATTLSALTGMRVLLPDYRLAPEHPFPAATDDCLAAYRWLVENGFSQRPLVVAGDSAGGSLTLVTLMRARDAMLRDAGLRGGAVAFHRSHELEPIGEVQHRRRSNVLRRRLSNSCRQSSARGWTVSNPLLSPLFGRWVGHAAAALSRGLDGSAARRLGSGPGPCVAGRGACRDRRVAGHAPRLPGLQLASGIEGGDAPGGRFHRRAHRYRPPGRARPKRRCGRR